MSISTFHNSAVDVTVYAVYATRVALLMACPYISITASSLLADTTQSAVWAVIRSDVVAVIALFACFHIDITIATKAVCAIAVTARCI